MASVGIATWKLLDWFGEVNGIKNISNYDADDVMIHTGGSTPLEVEYVPAGGEVEFQCQNHHVSISWRDGTGMHADIIRLEE